MRDVTDVHISSLGARCSWGIAVFYNSVRIQIDDRQSALNRSTGDRLLQVPSVQQE